MTNIEFEIDKQYMVRTDGVIAVSDSQKYLTASFTFTSEWNNKNIYIIYSTEGGVNYEVVYSQTSNLIPFEVLIGRCFFVSVYGTDPIDTSYRITTNKVKIDVFKSGYTSDISSTTTPSKDIFSDIFDELDERYDNVLKDGDYLVFYSEGVEKKRINISSSIGEESDPVFCSSVAYNITQSDVNNWNGKADASSVPTALSDLTGDSTHRVVTDSEKSAWNGKSDFSGSYNDLTNKPSIPSKTSDLTNDSSFQTQAEVSSAISTAISGVTQFDYTVVDSLPQTGVKGTIYLIRNDEETGSNFYDEYIYLNGDNPRWEKIGTTEVDLSNYYNKTETDTLLNSKANTATTYTKTEVDTLLTNKADTSTTYTKTETNTLLNTKQDTITDIETIRTNASNVNSKEDIGELTVSGTTYEVIVTNISGGTSGKLTFVI